ncbi:virulence protein RhuM/Fic/DOC family protein [Dyadobacter pollutisoli]|uniref:Virulence protein RhuM/Fic/DOC family protein n=1 Tax=Dyadobacter pollutisoli TaxID=2910158 RepID=A0A9E8NDF5_9BACT|nr:virulence protein RhuM/Fic/DOC family protein [Dyadobacter pollutisoli]WAC12966.1 virulence protein RhuM/Fic/DOC family protein [Dyadobacter pollutisoli]
MQNQIEIYQGQDGQTQIEVKFGEETVWLDAHSLAEIFSVQRPAIVKHINNIYKSNELDPAATCSILEQVAADGKKRKMHLYNLDVIISVGYRVNSTKATQFRQWATQRLRDYLIKGYAINEKRLNQKQQEVQTLRDGIRILSRAIEIKTDDADLTLLDQFAKGLELLDDYDHEQLDPKGITTRQAKYPEVSDYRNIIESMRRDFDSDIFGKEKDDSFQSSVAQISKGFGEIDFYPSIEEKAATLLYLIIKNHSFVDGNKRIAAACFLLFLESNGLLKSAGGTALISNEALASLTLFAASSKPEEMDTVKKLVISVLNRNQ